ncbi:hypothetical protein [Aureivirga sp. CE67]|uniref:hypothetical protein n=1 Tax=Aureivirga sp. CE67 TaxID=1788983 RepID=UPI0018CBBF39|nr:hypothetical protein [Aureivirga sp. CE67]
MKRQLLYLMLFFILISSCSKKVIALTGEVNLISENKYKSIELRSVGFGKNQDLAFTNSEIKAFKILFFRGIPNSSIDVPLVGSNEDEMMEKHKKYFDSFFRSRYKSFIMSTYESAPSEKKNGVYSVVNDLNINIKSLKKDLEDHNIIRKFGF